METYHSGRTALRHPGPAVRKAREVRRYTPFQEVSEALKARQGMWHAQCMADKLSSEAATGILKPEAWERLCKANKCYRSHTSPNYDEVFNEAVERVRTAASIGKTDIGALLFWKRLRADTRWVSELMVQTDNEVRDITAEAVAAATSPTLDVPEAAVQGRRALSKLPGFARGDALASALLMAAAPDRMAVYDRHAQKGLETLGLSLSPARGRYGRYMKIVEDLKGTAEHNGHLWTARDVDVALYWLGREG